MPNKKQVKSADIRPEKHDQIDSQNRSGERMAKRTGGTIQRGLNLLAQGLFYNLLLAAILSVLAILYHHQILNLQQLSLTLLGGAAFSFLFYAVRRQKRQFQALLRMAKELEQNQNQMLSHLREVEDRLDLIEGSESESADKPKALTQRTIEMSDDRGVHRLFATNQGDMRKPSELSRANEISDVLIAEMLDSALRKGQIDIFLQPIYTMPQRKMVGYEVYSRIKSGRDKFIPASRYMPLVISKNILPKIDQLQMAEIMKLLEQETNTKTLYFCNLSAGTLMDHDFMTRLIEQFRDNRPFARQIVFEIPAKDLERLKDYAVPLVNGLVRLGCRFSIDGWRLIEDDPELLSKIEAHFVKVEADQLRDQEDTESLMVLQAAIAELSRMGVSCIVKNIESDDAFKDALDFDVKMAQGKFLAEPAPYDVAKNAA